ncbi:MAG: hypothetical protein K2X51_12650 [Burkholderiales bacterium]|nr:hypothetical protein [Burkholderiales bacterium]
MTRKTSPYSRKRQAGHSYNGAEWLNAIQRSRPYTAETPIPGFFGTESAAVKAEILVRDALDTLLCHRAPLNAEHAFDLLAHALGVSVIRALQIEPHEARNPAIPILRDGSDALVRAIDRHQKTGAWGLDGPGRAALVDAVDAYAEILRHSSPAQMEHATSERMRILRGRVRVQTGGAA